MSYSIFSEYEVISMKFMRMFAIRFLMCILYVFFWKNNNSVIKIFDFCIGSNSQVNIDLKWYATKNLSLEFSHIFLEMASNFFPF